MEWLETHGFKRLVGRMATTGLLEVVATATPGIKDLLILGRIKAFEEAARTTSSSSMLPPPGTPSASFAPPPASGMQRRQVCCTAKPSRS